MKCLLCEKLSFSHICPSCQRLFLSPKIYRRQLPNGVDVYSFYNYKDIQELLYTKHTDLGYYIYNTLAKCSFKKFAQEFLWSEDVAAIGIDDTAKSGYSHTAILAKQLASHTIKPRYNKIRATNSVSYAGKSRQYRLMNPRNFVLHSFKEKYLILVDDIVTTGGTLTQAIELLQREDKEVLFCLSLADARVR